MLCLLAGFLMLTPELVAETNAQQVSASGYLSTDHVFPLFVDGTQSDGSYYVTTLMISNPSDTDDTTCALQLHGLTVAAFDLSYDMVPGGWIISSTSGTEPFQSGYATLHCSANVEPQLMYSYYSPDGTKVSEATTFSSPPAGAARLIGDQQNGSRLGIALANDSDQPATYTISMPFAGMSSSVIVGPRSSLARFLDELLPLAPSNAVADIVISSSNSTALAVGLRFTGNVFSTVPEASWFTAGPAAATSFVFPQFAVGKFGDGSYFQTAFIYQSLPGSDTCNQTYRGGIIGGGSLITTSPISKVFPLDENNLPPLLTGYSTIECSAPLDARESLSFYDPTGTKVSEATMLSEPSASAIQILADTRDGARIGLAIANDSDQTGTYTISVIGANGTTVGTAVLTIPARANAAEFIDQLVALPVHYYGKVIVSSSNGSASAIEMRFTGNVFTTVPETIR